jgi:hypothetical protein
VTAPEVFAYVYGVLQAPAYARRFHEALRVGFPRVPFPARADLFAEVAWRGEELLALHCLEREAAAAPGSRLVGAAGRSLLIDQVAHHAAAEELAVGGGARVSHVSVEVWRFEVSGYRVLERWLAARRGLVFTRGDVAELLALVHALRATVQHGPALDAALARIVEGPQLALAPGPRPAQGSC